MQTSKLKSTIGGIGCLFGLAACDAAPATMGFLDPSVFRGGEAPEVHEVVLSGTVLVSTPDGYCVDDASKRSGRAGNFVVLAPCAGLRVPGIEWPETVAVITVSATRAAIPAVSAEELEAFVTSPEGRSLLSSSADRPVEILQTESQSGAFFMRVVDASDPVQGLEGTYWRGLIAAGGRLVSLSVRGYDAETLSASTGLRMIRNLAAEIRMDSRSLTSGTGGVERSPLTNPFARLFRNRE